MTGSQGRRTGYISFHSEYENEFRLPYYIPDLTVKLTFHIYPPLLLFDEKVERQQRSTAKFCSNIFPEVDAMQ